jgi:hypothetical protein
MLPTVPKARRLVLIVLLLVGASACGVGKSDFQRNAGDAGAELAAAARTLEAVHDGRLDTRYARASFANYREQLSGVESDLSTAGTVPDPATRDSLLRLYRIAQQAIDAPCLEPSCDWQGQVRALDSAAEAFIAAGGG